MLIGCGHYYYCYSFDDAAGDDGFVHRHWYCFACCEYFDDFPGLCCYGCVGCSCDRAPIDVAAAGACRLAADFVQFADID